MSWEDYAATTHQWPYLVRIEGPRRTLVYFGAQHTVDPDDPQISQLQRIWNDFRPNRAFNEGGDPPVASSARDAVRQDGEAGLVRWLAARDGVRVSSMDLSRALQANALRAKWSAETIKTFFIARALLPCESRSDCNRETEGARILPIIESTTGLRSPPDDWMGFVRELNKISPSRAEHRQWFDPTRTGHPFNQMARYLEDFRDRQMMIVLVDAVRTGERVFAVAGGSHVVRQEPALRAELDSRR